MVLVAVRRPGGVVRVGPQFDQVAPNPYTLLVRALEALTRHARDQVPRRPEDCRGH
ncbi:hypothetical protein EV652_1056 [Kribbella steppae]|uniref:Uncharacterized protein n=1 Tax=Kribbella steppae TaxID=2512223 RepID=A0A4R2HJR9_9ACTN|nr:hypothetical protein EV652_1056 [Kribbella steppae]